MMKKEKEKEKDFSAIKLVKVSKQKSRKHLGSSVNNLSIANK